jgi:DNA uptake protein ComE-like DNA-binding protein
VLVAFAGCGGAADDDASAAADTAAVVAAPEPAPETAEGALIDPGQASREALLTVPHIDDALADALIQNRPYDTMVAVDKVLAGSLSEEQRDEVYARLWKPLDLNSASGEEILLIPGVGERMEHEFEEYRPYQGIEQFRREIGKYVDEQEVARLERYVTIR